MWAPVVYDCRQMASLCELLIYEQAGSWLGATMAVNLHIQKTATQSVAGSSPSRPATWLSSCVMCSEVGALRREIKSLVHSRHLGDNKGVLLSLHKTL